MNQLTIDLDNCYGIKRLYKQLDFTTERVYAIYAPNGQMKTSLAKAFQDIAGGTKSTDRIFPARTTKNKITDERGVDLPKDSVLVVGPYDEEFCHTEKTSTLLVDTKLRMEYEQIHADIDASKDALLEAMKEQSKSKKNLEREISSAFTSSEDDFYTAIIRIKNELQEQKEAPFAEVVYDKIFDEKVLSVLGTTDVKSAIAAYVQRYNELLAASTFFKKGTFDYYNAGQIAKSLASNGFFEANHTVHLNGITSLEVIKTQKELEDVITREKEAIIKDKALRAQFNKLSTALEKNVTLRDFQNYMLDHEALLSQLDNVNKFKEAIWKSYLKSHYDLYVDLVSKFEKAQKRTAEIEAEARGQRTQWQEVIDIFNARFIVPFTLVAENQIAVMLGYQNLVTLGFTYHDGAENAKVEKTALLKALSTGEKKALYILNVIFEVNTRRKNNQETIMVIDDIADSFDYQNKYAIIQYLKDISRDGLFKQIIMTHNFDFFRTIHGRFVASPQHCLMSSKTPTGITLDLADGIQNMFLKDWKGKFFTDKKKMIASIPFIRNLIEYSRNTKDPDYLKLTSLLHWKSDSAAITEGDLGQIYAGFFGGANQYAGSSKPVIDILGDEAKACMASGTGINFENKIVLSIAIRLLSEQFMIKKIADPTFVASIRRAQTSQLLDKFKSLFPGDDATLQVLDRVMLMTPENIHLNSFMYEPIVDMNDDQLRRLYGAVSGLK